MSNRPKVETGINVDFDLNLKAACRRIKEAREAGSGLLILTGAGMSVSSGVPVFRNSDGSMSADFLQFLAEFNRARAKYGLSEAPDWFEFSVPEMFQEETAKEAWNYWRWRMLRALVEPAVDYQLLMKIVNFVGSEKVFVKTSNCDMLHERAGMPTEQVEEIHGSLGRLQCSGGGSNLPCCQDLYPVDEMFLNRLRGEPGWIPSCDKCKTALRPNVMIFDDHVFVEKHLRQQEVKFDHFVSEFLKPSSTKGCVVLEIGAGVVVPSIRHAGESYGLSDNNCLVRVNPSTEECKELRANVVPVDQYFPLACRSEPALAAICRELELWD